MAINLRTAGQLLPAFIKNKTPMLLVAPPGIGKTSIVTQTAEKLGLDLIVDHAVTASPIDYKGMPTQNAGEVDFRPIGVLKQLLDVQKPTLCFFDDLGTAPKAVQAALMQILLGRRIGPYAIPDDVHFIAATNRPEDRAGVAPLLSPLLNRFAILNIKPDLEVWLADYARPNAIDPFIEAFLTYFENTQDPSSHLLELEPFSQSHPGNLTEAFPSPRSWALLNETLRGLTDTDLEPYVHACIGASIGTGFVHFLETVANLPSYDAITADPNAAAVSTNPSHQLATAGMLAQTALPIDMPAICRYIERLNQEIQFLFTHRLQATSNPNQRTAAFVELVAQLNSTLV